MTEPRLRPPAELDADQEAALERTVPGADGSPLNIFATLARRPRLLRHLSRLGGYFPRHSALATRDRELVILRTAARVRSTYVEAHHRVMAEDAGVVRDEIDAADPSSAYAWGARDEALLRFADELLERHVVSDVAWHALDGALDDVQRMELAVLVGFYSLFGGLANTVGVEEDAFRSRWS